jgi:hypothetical protein
MLKKNNTIAGAAFFSVQSATARVLIPAGLRPFGQIDNGKSHLSVGAASAGRATRLLSTNVNV